MFLTLDFAYPTSVHDNQIPNKKLLSNTGFYYKTRMSSPQVDLTFMKISHLEILSRIPCVLDFSIRARDFFTR